MRFFKQFSIAASVLFWCFTGTVFAEAPTLAPGQEEVVLKVENMTWAACVVAVRNSLKRLDGIESIDVDYDAEEAIVVYSPAVVDPSSMIEATKAIGFPSSVKSSAVTPRS